jgi:hypothetical protein
VGLSNFLETASRTKFSSKAQKRLVRSAVNHWKREFDGDLYYKNRKVKFAVTGGAGQDGLFAVYIGPSSEKSYLYSGTDVPANLSFRVKRSAT